QNKLIRVAQKCGVVIQNIRKEELSITLWGDVAESFCSLSMGALSVPIVIVFTSLKIKLYRERIKIYLLFLQQNICYFYKLTQVTSSFKTSRGCENTATPSQQANEAQILQTAKRVTIDELAFLDLDLYKDDTFLCKTSVKCITIQRVDIWFATNTPIKFQCIGNMYKVNLILEYHTNEIIALRNNFNSSDVLIYDASDATSIEPTTPQTLVREISMSFTVVSSSMSTPDTITESHKRTKVYWQ
ncbi:hypothetical protein DVH24_027609, partial [Malus domestica]